MTDLPGALTEDDFLRQREMLANRTRKNFKRLHKTFQRENIDVFRLYDWDIPEIRVVVDWYAGHTDLSPTHVRSAHIVVGEYERQQTQSIEHWLARMAEAAAQALSVPAEQIHLKTRTTGGTTQGSRYDRLGRESEMMVVRERELEFYVNLDDYIDTGLFADHRDTRQLVKEESAGRRFLNLYAYTGTFTCAAVLGGASASTTVDLSNNYLGWAEKNFALNNLPDGPHAFIKSDCLDFLKKAKSQKQTWDLCVLDPPSFSTQHGSQSGLQIQRDHAELIQAALDVLDRNGTLYFSTNHQRFAPRMNDVNAQSIDEITSETIPIDYRNKQTHRCWRIEK